jgi:hypothetical protein
MAIQKITSLKIISASPEENESMMDYAQKWQKLPAKFRKLSFSKMNSLDTTDRAAFVKALTSVGILPSFEHMIEQQSRSKKFFEDALKAAIAHFKLAINNYYNHKIIKGISVSLKEIDISLRKYERLGVLEYDGTFLGINGITEDKKISKAIDELNSLKNDLLYLDTGEKPSNESGNKISQSAIALLYFYLFCRENGQAITLSNGTDIASKYGYTSKNSGHKLYQLYTKYGATDYRTCVTESNSSDKAKKKTMEQVLELLLNYPKAHKLASDEYKTFIIKFSKHHR